MTRRVALGVVAAVVFVLLAATISEAAIVRNDSGDDIALVEFRR